mgnify:FL=1
MKKILATILALVLALGLTATVWAADVSGSTSTKAAKIGGTEYGTLQDAINAASDGENTVVVLLNNLTESITVAKEKSITLDLSGYTLTNEAGKHTITNYGDLTITSTGVVDNVSHARAALYNAPGAVATLNGGTFDRSYEAGQNADDNGGNSYYTIKNFGEMVVNSGVTVQQDGTSNHGTNGKFSSLFANGWQSVSTAGQGSEPAYTKDAVLTINGGTFIGGLNTVKNDDCGVMTINGGEFKNFAQACVQNHNKLTITNGKFDGSELQAASRTVSVIYNCGCGADNDKGMLSISGGTFIGGKERTYVICDVSTVSEAYTDISGGTFTKGSATMIGKIDSAKVAVSGGTFKDAAGNAVDVSAYLVAGKQQNSDGSVGNKSYYYYPSTSDTTTSTTTKGSPKTFDAGIGIYAVTAVLSVTGMAWTAKKRH